MSTVKKIKKLSGASDELLAVDCAIRDIQGRKIVDTYATKGEIPTELPANGGNASYATTAGNADKCNNHTLGCDVPANADFTNTWPSAYIATISKSGNTLTITPNTGSAITFTNTTYSNATQSTAGLMSAADKLKLDGIESGAEKNKITGIQLNGTTIAPDANGVVNIQSSGGGTQKYLHHVVFSWGTGSASTYKGGTLAFDFLDTTPTPYSDSDLNYGDLITFIKAHCNITGASNIHEILHINAQLQYRTDSSKACISANALINDYGSWYIEGAVFAKNTNDFYVASEYAINWIPTSDAITLRDIVG